MSLYEIPYIPIESSSELATVLARLEWIHTQFDTDQERHRRQMGAFDQLLNTVPIRRHEKVKNFTYELSDLPSEFAVPECKSNFFNIEEQTLNLQRFLQRNYTQGLLVYHRGSVRYERYFGDHDERTRWMTFSASKLIVGMLIAIALEDDLIECLDDSVIKYAPELKGTAWDGVTVDHCLKMTTGIEWDEEDLDLYRADSPFARLFHEVAFGSIENHIRSFARAADPGSRICYSSIDTEMLGTVLIRATGMGIAEYLEERVWKRAGMEADAYWVTDPKGRELALSGLCATLRDYARLGVLLLHGGELDGSKIIPRWFTESLSQPSEEIFELPGIDDFPLINWNQSFIFSDPAQNQGDFAALGSFGQFIYVHPASQTVIAHQGVYPNIRTEYAEVYKHFWAFRGIIKHLEGERSATSINNRSAD